MQAPCSWFLSSAACLVLMPLFKCHFIITALSGNGHFLFELTFQCGVHQSSRLFSAELAGPTCTGAEDAVSQGSGHHMEFHQIPMCPALGSAWIAIRAPGSACRPLRCYTTPRKVWTKKGLREALEEPCGAPHPSLDHSPPCPTPGSISRSLLAHRALWSWVQQLPAFWCLTNFDLDVGFICNWSLNLFFQVASSYLT